MGIWCFVWKWTRFWWWDSRYTAGALMGQTCGSLSEEHECLLAGHTFSWPAGRAWQAASVKDVRDNTTHGHFECEHQERDRGLWLLWMWQEQQRNLILNCAGTFAVFIGTHTESLSSYLGRPSALRLPVLWESQAMCWDSVWAPQSADLALSSPQPRHHTCQVLPAASHPVKPSSWGPGLMEQR